MTASFFRVFFQSACDVPELEEKFNIDEYSDMVTLSKPVIYISIEEIINTHSVNPSTFNSFRADLNNLSALIFCPEPMMSFSYNFYSSYIFCEQEVVSLVLQM